MHTVVRYDTNPLAIEDQAIEDPRAIEDLYQCR
jgi:hypothetical protein